jgi:flagellar basal-body rod protein FlgC
MNLFHSMNISASGMSAERLRMDVIASNIANADTTRTPEGGAYKRHVSLMQAQPAVNSFQFLFHRSKAAIFEPYLNGVRVGAVVEDPSPMKMVYDPTHPDAKEDGYVEYPNVNVMTEMVELITASRGYESNVTAFNSVKNMALKALEIGR